MEYASAAIEAREEAAAEVSRLLASAEQLDRVPSLRDRYERQLHAVQTQLAHIVQSQVEQATEGLSLLRSSFDLIESVRTDLVDIEKLCETSSLAIDNFDVIREVNIARQNITATLGELESILGIPNEASEIRTLLAQSANLLRAHTRIQALEERRDAALRQGHLHAEDIETLQSHFRPVDDLVQLLEEKLFLVVRTSLAHAQAEPATLVAACRVIEREESADARRATLGSTAVPKRYRMRALREVQRGIAQSFEEDIAAANGDPGEIMSVLERSVDELTIVCDQVRPCFPPSYGIVDLFLSEYHTHAMQWLSVVVDRGSLEAKDALRAVKWIRAYRPQLTSLGLEQPQPHAETHLDNALRLYCDAIAGMMNRWSRSIIEEDVKGSYERSDAGMLYTFAPVEAFKMVTQQMEVAVDVRLDRFTYAVASACASALESFARDWNTALARSQPGKSFEYVCAVLSNCARCIELVDDFESRVMQSIDDGNFRAAVSMKPAADAFMELARSTLTALSTMVFGDLAPLLAEIASEAWLHGTHAANIAATIADYCSDIAAMVSPVFFRKAVQRVATELAQRYAEAIVTRKIPTVLDDVAKRIERDVVAFTECLAPFAPPKAVLDDLRVLGDLAALVEADSADAVCIAVSMITGRVADVSPAVLDKLVALAGKLDKPQRKTALDQCRSMLAKVQKNKQQAAGDGAAAPSSNVFALVRNTLERGGKKTR